MKNLTLLSVLIFLSTVTFAQDGYFIRGTYGAGTSGSSFKPFDGNGYQSNSSIFSQQAQFNVGYQKGKLRIETGLSYLVTGLSFMKRYDQPFCGMLPIPGDSTKQVTPTPTPSPHPSAYYAKFSVTNPHIVVPVVVSRTVYDGKKFSVTPGIGIEGVYNFKGKMSTKDPAYSEVNLTINYGYNTFSAMALMKFDVQYKINDKFSVVASPSFQSMISSLTTRVPGDNMSRIYDHALLVNIGMQYNLSQSKLLSKPGKAPLKS